MQVRIAPRKGEWVSKVPDLNPKCCCSTQRIVTHVFSLPEKLEWVGEAHDVPHLRTASQERVHSHLRCCDVELLYRTQARLAWPFHGEACVLFGEDTFCFLHKMCFRGDRNGNKDFSTTGINPKLPSRRRARALFNKSFGSPSDTILSLVFRRFSNNCSS